MTQAQSLADLSQIYTASALGNRNWIIDGAMDSWISSAAIPISNNGFTQGAATMFAANTGASGAANIQKAPLTPGFMPAFGAPFDAVAALGYQQTTAPTGAVAGQIYARMESVRTLNAKSATFSCWLWCQTPPLTVTQVWCTQYFGSGGSPSANVGFGTAVNWVLGAQPKRFSVRLDVPSVNGMTLGTNNNDFLQIALSFQQSGTWAAYTNLWQLEQSPSGCSGDLNGNGGLPTLFEYRGQQPELARVQRYYEAGTQPHLYISTIQTSGNVNAYADCTFATTKRAAPAISVNSWQYYSNGTNTACPTASALNPFTDRFQFQFRAMNTWNGWCGTGTWIADARL